MPTLPASSAVRICGIALIALAPVVPAVQYIAVRLGSQLVYYRLGA